MKLLKVVTLMLLFLKAGAIAFARAFNLAPLY